MHLVVLYLLLTTTELNKSTDYTFVFWFWILKTNIQKKKDLFLLLTV